MSSAPPIRRAERLMAEEEALRPLQQGLCGRLASVSEDGSPDCVPLLYVVDGERLYVHNTTEHGHLRINLEHEPRVCFEVDEPGQVFDYGRFECDSSVSYRSVIAFGTMRIVTDPKQKQKFFEALMGKYRTAGRERPRGFFPRIGRVIVYEMTIERMTGKEQVLPGVAQQWPALDRTPTPDAQPPSADETNSA